MIQRNSQAKVPVADLLDEYFRLRQAVRLLRDSSVLPFLAEIAAEKKSRPNSQLKKLFIANGAQVRAQVGKLLAFSAIDKRTFLRRMSDTFKKELWDSAAIEKLVVTLNSRCETIESTLSVFPPSIDKSRIYLAKSWEYFLYDLDGINLFSSSISDDHPNVNALLNELRADSIPTPQLGAEDIHSLAWYIFIEQFGRGEVKAQQLARETELGFRRSLQAFAADLEEWRNANLPVDVLPPARLLWNIGRSPGLMRDLGSEAAFTLQGSTGADGRFRQHRRRATLASGAAPRPPSTAQRFAHDSPLEEAGFELSVPPERKAVPSAIARSFGNPPASLAAVGDRLRQGEVERDEGRGVVDQALALEHNQDTEIGRRM